MRPRPPGTGLACPKAGGRRASPTLYRQGGREAQRGQDTHPGPHSTHTKFGLDLSGPAAKGPCPFCPRQQCAGVRKPAPPQLEALACPCRPWARAVAVQGHGQTPGRGAAPSWATSGCCHLSCQGPSVCVELGLAPGRLARQLAIFPGAFTGSDFCRRQQPPAGTTGLRRGGGTRPTPPLVSLWVYVLGSPRSPTRQQDYLEPVLLSTACKRLPGPERSAGLGSSCVALGKSLSLWASPPLPASETCGNRP